MKKMGTLEKDAPFEERVLFFSDIIHGKRYYSSIIFVPNYSQYLCKRSKLIAKADTAHCTGVGLYSYGTPFEVLVYDVNSHILPLLFFYSVVVESNHSCKAVLTFLNGI